MEELHLGLLLFVYCMVNWSANFAMSHVAVNMYQKWYLTTILFLVCRPTVITVHIRQGINIYK